MRIAKQDLSLLFGFPSGLHLRRGSQHRRLRKPGSGRGTSSRCRFIALNRMCSDIRRRTRRATFGYPFDCLDQLRLRLLLCPRRRVAVARVDRMAPRTGPGSILRNLGMALEALALRNPPRLSRIAGVPRLLVINHAMAAGVHAASAAARNRSFPLRHARSGPISSFFTHECPPCPLGRGVTPVVPALSAIVATILHVLHVSKRPFPILMSLFHCACQDGVELGLLLYC